MTRNEARETLMQIMYEMEASKTISPETASRLTEEKLSGNHIVRGKDLLFYIIDHLDEIDGSINACSRSWKTNRMPKVDLAIMRLSIGEIRCSDDVPNAVIINEAINLAKKFSTDQSSRFIHGILGAILNQHEE